MPIYKRVVQMKTKIALTSTLNYKTKKLYNYMKDKTIITFRLMNHPEYFITGVITSINGLDLICGDEFDRGEYSDYNITILTDYGKEYFYLSEIDLETIHLHNHDPIRYFIRKEITPEIRDFIFKRDNYECMLRSEGCTGKAECCDHIIPVSLGGRTIIENLRASCNHCNQIRGARL